MSEQVAALPATDADAMQGLAITESAPKDSTPAAPEQVSETLYIQNLNEKIKTDVMKTSLRGLFKAYGNVLDVVAHRNLRMRGQAFVSFESAEIAAKAMKEVNRFPLYSKPMQISFAKTRSDVVVQALDKDNYDAHHKARLERKRKARWNNPHAQKARGKRAAAAADGTAAPVTGPKRPVVQMPDEYLPPNKILFLQNLPESVTKDQLLALFGQYPNFHEVRLIPTKKDIAFVEYLDEGSATVAKEALHNYKLDGESKIKVTFARK